MHSSLFDEIRPKVSTVSHFNPVEWCPTLLQNFVRTHVSRSYLAMDTKPMHPSHRRHLEVHIIPNCKLQRPSSLVRINFLLALSCLQMTLNNADLLSSFFDEIRSKISTGSHFNLVKWCPTFLSIYSFKGRHTNAFLIAIVVRKLSKVQAFIPLFRKRNGTSSQHILKYLVYPFSLAISLWMIS